MITNPKIDDKVETTEELLNSLANHNAHKAKRIPQGTRGVVESVDERQGLVVMRFNDSAVYGEPVQLRWRQLKNAK